ncbi:chloramphenicol phosphotransferase CPT family protein [Streptomyces sp. AC550_RSS872]|uniref:chloramphenicol phosphotransferase CPT family protein n=1 Tax=Streptomyces sp. AC550_RSS872 TaxID=2823689 RepID=UPI001C2551E0|nr:chloramphenicol phosphotransferase CPT family protein [Streptomyces sp. AC550_RSS872]
MSQGLILYGPPASGKDTVTQALTELDSRYTQFARLKVGSGKSAGYRMGSAEQLLRLEAAGGVIYANHRYGNTYVIDRPGVDAAFEAGVPVVHLGQVDGIRALVDGYAADWAVVLLWCPKAVTAQRSAGRGDSDTAARLAAWEATREDVDGHRNVVWDLTVDTSVRSAEESARLIDQLLVHRAGAATA